MGLGDMFSSIFGGGNNYNYAMPPTVGGAKRPGETDQQYQARLQGNYDTQNQAYQSEIDRAQNRTVPQNTVNFNQANATAAQQGNLASALQGRMGQNIDFGAANQTLGQSQGLANQLLAQGRGEGPNPALNQLRMTTDQNIQQQAAMLGSNRGINPALAARIAGQQGANANQQAAGQAGLQSAQQQLGAQQAAGGLLGQISGAQTQMAGMNAQQQQAYAQLLNQALMGQRQQDIAGALGQTQMGLGLMGQNTNQEMGLRQAQLAYQNQMNNVYNNANAINAGVSAQNSAQNFQWGMGAATGLSQGLGGIAGGMLGLSEGGKVPPLPHGDKKVGIVMKEFGKGKLSSSSGQKVTNPKQAIAIALSEQRKAEGHAHGGMIPGYANGGMTQFQDYAANADNPMASFYRALGEAGQSANDAGNGFQKAMGGMGSALGKLGPKMGGASAMGDFAGGAGGLGGAIESAGPALALAATGGKVAGKAKVKGDSETNDRVPAMLSPGEIVIPRSKAKSAEDAHGFLDHILKTSKKPKSYGDVVRSKKDMEERVSALEKMAYGGCA